MSETENDCENEIKEGSVVRLRSGGSAMTVSRIEHSFTRNIVIAHCHWIDESGHGREYTFPLNTLMRY